VSAPARRQQVAYAKARGLSERRACALMSVARSALHYRSKLAERDAPVLAEHSVGAIVCVRRTRERTYRRGGKKRRVSASRCVRRSSMPYVGPSGGHLLCRRALQRERTLCGASFAHQAPRTNPEGKGARRARDQTLNTRALGRRPPRQPMLEAILHCMAASDSSIRAIRIWVALPPCAALHDAEERATFALETCRRRQYRSTARRHNAAR
jgi:hypothetical protein